MCSIIDKYGTLLVLGTTKLFHEEEFLNLGLLALNLFATPTISYLIYTALTLWALIVIVHWFHHELLKQPNLLGISLLKPLLERVILYKVEVIKVKNHIELAIGMYSLVMLIGLNIAPFFPIFYWQYLRVKYVANHFTKNSFKVLDYGLKTVVPQRVYEGVIVKIKGKIREMVSY